MHRRSSNEKRSCGVGFRIGTRSLAQAANTIVAALESHNLDSTCKESVILSAPENNVARKRERGITPKIS